LHAVAVSTHTPLPTIPFDSLEKITAARGFLEFTVYLFLDEDDGNPSLFKHLKAGWVVSSVGCRFLNKK